QLLGVYGRPGLLLLYAAILSAFAFATWSEHPPGGMPKYPMPWPDRLAFTIGYALIAVLALASPIFEPDSTTYHVMTARVWAHSVGRAPLLFGPSVGAPLGANYPPLFPAIGAFLLTITGSGRDALLQAVAPMQALGGLLLLYGMAA